MEKILHITLVSFIWLTIFSCAKIDNYSETANASLTKQVWSFAYDFLNEAALESADKQIISAQKTGEAGGNTQSDTNRILLVKRDSSGTKEWIKELGISDEESGISMSVDSSENIYVTGYSGQEHEANKNQGQFEVFLTKYNSSGTKEWTKQLGNSETEYGAGLTVDSADNIYVTGFGEENTLLAKYDPSGTKQWTKQLVSSSPDFAWDVTVDSADKIYVTGFSEASLMGDLNRQHDEILLLKFNSDGMKL
ncbi:MAG: hypothetical protein MAG581_02614 [Deltaproteobacteria bacterium]|jgi:hypothetical protein|nr:hypothetical protein [Deltaproteobacteria bacterium]